MIKQSSKSYTNLSLELAPSLSIKMGQVVHSRTYSYQIKQVFAFALACILKYCIFKLFLPK